MQNNTFQQSISSFKPLLLQNVVILSSSSDNQANFSILQQQPLFLNHQLSQNVYQVSISRV